MLIVGSVGAVPPNVFSGLLENRHIASFMGRQKVSYPHIETQPRRTLPRHLSDFRVPQ